MEAEIKMIKIRILDDGNFTRWFRLCLIFIGIGLMYWTIKYVEPSLWSGFLLLFGFGIALVGGMTSRAALLKIKPFDSSYKKARKSYEIKDEDNNSGGKK
ncbi:hypothetical protein ACFSHT_34290 [Paraburkholderia silviterrae]|uniref:Uncharacterized protein n=1 Tax=Paraburkholderia silviterrae TaxID=2528715 RepID=A0A4V6PJ31_9BURK|nr:hypothetical protein [Paraburkholderia silviterrae]TDG21475.1 hypothetical protein EYW47_21615 [Paraburkholderia silviterrae]